ncbi:MAG: hypothetical protein ACI9LM_005085 [Alteromonadaceae bacterium]|jgi:hypothetical protein
MKNIEQLSDEKKATLMERYSKEIDWKKNNFSVEVYFSWWVKTQDPDYMDSVVIECNRVNIPLKGVLLEQLAVASSNRILRSYSYRNDSKIDRYFALDKAYKSIFELCEFCGKTREDATLLVATKMADNFPTGKQKASTLDKGYLAWIKTKEGRELTEELKTKYYKGWSDEAQKQVLLGFPEPNTDYQGSRRGNEL